MILQLQYAKHWILTHWYVYRAGLVLVISGLVVGAEAAVVAPYKTGVITALTAGGGVELMRDLLGRDFDKQRLEASRQETAYEKRRRLRSDRRAARRLDEALRRAEQVKHRAEQAESQAEQEKLRAEQAESENAELRRILEQQQNGAVDRRRVTRPYSRRRPAS